jgi:hypothetical protein
MDSVPLVAGKMRGPDSSTGRAVTGSDNFPTVANIASAAKTPTKSREKFHSRLLAVPAARNSALAMSGAVS